MALVRAKRGDAGQAGAPSVAAAAGSTRADPMELVIAWTRVVGKETDAAAGLVPANRLPWAGQGACSERPARRRVMSPVVPHPAAPS